MRPLRVVCIGGGTGLSTLLRGIRQYVASNSDGCQAFDMDALTAIVSVSDDGGSSGRLIDEFGVLPPGDIRNCLVALADEDETMSRLFEHRFESNGALRGHSVGNLLLIALTHINNGSFPRAIQEASRVLAVRGRILPVSVEPTTLCAELVDGTVVRGESAIPNRPNRSPIRRVFLAHRTENGHKDNGHGSAPESSEPIHALPDALQAIHDADAIIIGPGSLYTSILPNLAVPEVAEALRRTKAVTIFVCNVMAEPGETDGFSVTDYVSAIRRHVDFPLRYVLTNSKPASDEALKRYLRAELLETYRRLERQTLDVWKQLDKDEEFNRSFADLVEHMHQVVDNLSETVDRSRVQVMFREGVDTVAPAEHVEDDMICEQEIRERNAILRVIRHDPPKLAGAIVRLLRRHYNGGDHPS
jgi:uncharacterized cofD-like protein